MDHIKQIGDDCTNLSIGKWSGKIISKYENSELLSLFSSDVFPSQDFPGQIENIHSNIGKTFKAKVSDGAVLFGKRFEQRKFEKAINSLFVPMEAARSWKASWLLLKNGISTPPPIAVMEQKRLGMNSKTVFIARAIPHTPSKSLITFCQETFDHSPLPMEKVREKRLLINMLAEFYKKVHQKNAVYFPDFHPHNFVLEKTPDGRHKLYIVDFDEVNFKIRKDDVMKNLSSLGRNTDKVMKKSKHQFITTGDRLRFIKAYLGDGKNDRASSQKLWKNIIKNYQLK